MSDMTNKGCFKDAVCIETQRIFDSCQDKDCLEDLEVVFTDEDDRKTIEHSAFIKAKCVEVTNVTFSIDPVAFNKGFYAVNITYTFGVQLDAYCNASQIPTTVTGTASFPKKVILYGSEGCSKTFTSVDTITEPESMDPCCCKCTSLPKASVSVVDPIILDAKLLCKPVINCKTNPCDCATEKTHDRPQGKCKNAYVTIGLFSIVSLSRPVSMVVPVYDYCVPDKECTSNTDSPCELFEKIDFPVDEFFPRGIENKDCCCSEKQDNDEN